MSEEAVYQLNVYGCVYPEKGKKIFYSKKVIYNRLEKYRLQILEKFSKRLSPSEFSDLKESINNGYQITRIDKLMLPDWKSYFKNGTFIKNEDQKRVDDYDEDED